MDNVPINIVKTFWTAVQRDLRVCLFKMRYGSGFGRDERALVLRTVSLSDELSFESVTLDVVRPNGYTVGVSSNDGIMVLVVRREEIICILRPNEYVMRLQDTVRLRKQLTSPNYHVPFHQLAQLSCEPLRHVGGSTAGNEPL